MSSRLVRRSKAILKQSYWRISNQGQKSTKLLFILGGQRSGTTLMTEIFDRDWNAKVYGERCRLTDQDLDNRLRLNSLDTVAMDLAQDQAPLIVLKPLVESQRATEILNYFDNSKAMWMYRHYRPTVASRILKWGTVNPIRSLKAVVDVESNNWRSEGVSEHSRDIARHFFSEDMNYFDAAALFWLIRNRLFFELGLEKRQDVILCKYETLVTRPESVMRGIYDFIGSDFPGNNIVANVNSNSLNKEHSFELSPEIEDLCQQMMRNFDHTLSGILHL